MELCYSDFRRFDDKLDAILGYVKKDARDEAEIAALRAEIKKLVDALAIAQEEKDALNAKIGAALTKSQKIEDTLRGAVPNSP